MRHLERRVPEPPLFPADPACRAGVEVFIGWFENVYKAAPNAIEDEIDGGDPDRELIERLGAEMGARLDVFEGLLSGSDYLLIGELTAADFVAYPFLKYALAPRPGRHRDLPRHPRRAPAARRRAPQPARLDRAHRGAAARILRLG